MSFYSSSSFSTSGAVDSNGDPDLLYYNALIINNKSNQPEVYNDDPPATYTDIRAKPLINNVSNFDFSIMNFDMNGSGKKLPLFIPEIECQLSKNPTIDFNKTVYTVGATVNFQYLQNNSPAISTLATKTIYASRTIQFNPENKNANTPYLTPYPEGSVFVDDIVSVVGQMYKYNNLQYKCITTPIPISADQITYVASYPYQIGELAYNGVNYGVSLVANNTTVIPVSSNASWSVALPWQLLNITGYVPTAFLFNGSDIYQKTATVIPTYYNALTAYGIGTVASYLGNLYTSNLVQSGNLPTNAGWTPAGTYSYTNPVYWTPKYYYPTPTYVFNNTNNYQLIQQATSIQQDLTTNYYYLSTYKSFLLMINNALDLLWDDLNSLGSQFITQNNVGIGVLNKSTWVNTQNVSPYFQFNQDTQLFEIVAEQDYFIKGGFTGTLSSPLVGFNPTSYPIVAGDIATGTNTGSTNNVLPTFQLFLNENLWNLFASFNVIRVKNEYLSSLTAGNLLTIGGTIAQNTYSVNNYSTPYYIPIYDQGDNNYTPPSNICESAMPAMFKMTQDYPTTSTLWSPVSAIVFTSTLPLFNELAGEPTLYDNSSGQNGYTSSSTAPFTPTITDVSIPLKYASDYRGFVNYTPSAEYRMVATTGQGSAISNIELQVFWKNRLDGRLYPIRLSNYSNIGIKMLFRRKGINNK